MFEKKNAQPSQRWRWSRNFYVGRFLFVHLLCLAAFWTGISMTAMILFAVMYVLRMFAVTAGYHRYFSHRTYKMGRVMQFIMAFLSQTSGQKGVLWWASHHRHHHTHSDDPDDVHSPKHHGFWYAHVGWLFDPDWADTDDKRVKDLARYPELVWIDRYHFVPTATAATACFLIGGWSGLVVGFLWSTIFLWHVTFTINSLAHVIGDRRYETDDESKNHWLLALLTFGEGWHNNHHHYQASANQGFYWWEYDISYYILKAMSWVGLVHDLRNPPEHVVEDKPHPKVAARQEKEKQKSQETASAEEGSEAIGSRVHAIKLSATQAQEEASRKVREIRLAAATRYDELSDEASRQYTEFSEAASKKVDGIRESALAAQEEAEKKVDQIVDSLNPEPKPAAD